MSWADKAAKTPVGTGNFLKVKNGIGYDFKFDDINAETQDQEVDKPAFKGDGTTKKWWYQVVLKNVSIVNEAYATVEKDAMGAEDFDKVLTQERDKVYTLELPATGRKAIGTFISENEIGNDDVVRLVRTGTGYKTKYEFSKVE